MLKGGKLGDWQGEELSEIETRWMKILASSMLWRCVEVYGTFGCILNAAMCRHDVSRIYSTATATYKHAMIIYATKPYEYMLDMADIHRGLCILRSVR